MRILIRTSKWAIRARRLASLSLPLIVIPVLLHRQGLIESNTFHVMLWVAFAVVVATLACALIALVRLWFTGDRGWDRAIVGLVAGLVCLAPFAWAGAMASRYPAATDIATADRQRLPLVLDGATATMSPPLVPNAAALEATFPNAKTRTYPLTAQQVFDVAMRLVEDRGWDLQAQTRPPAPGAEGRINARVTTLFGWRDDVVIALAGDPEGARVDMRSASLAGRHDLGANGQRVEEFLGAMDAEVTALLRDNPNIGQPIIEPPAEAGDAEEVAPGQ
ncbi:hypothetical protein VE25_18135 [Devosia geojensis]|uniref:DUF1499 domain-containing protein n=1 Tax=Devosia geojensis TaxID=443610 RepID=A0A0F5FI94_9HYPH|nr:DUF1499 domain-containing protein [Devosia geojensis]KKB08556.1 hypothetical protein VE25_18135 [Devosia geojensis]